jgi:hypothetical protein
VTVGIKWPGPLPGKDDTRVARAQGSKKTRPSKGAITDQWSRSPLSENGCHRCPLSTKTTDQRFKGRPGCEPSKPVDAKSRGHPAATPQRPYRSGLQNLTLEGFEQVPQIARVRDDESAHIRSYPRARRLEGVPHVVFKSQ